MTRTFKQIIVTIAVIMIFTAALVNGQVTSGFRFTRNLYRGLTGQDVSELQKFLKTMPDVYSGAVKGYYGLLTEAAVKKFQTKYGINPVGTVGPVTRAKLNELIISAGVSASPTASATGTPAPSTPATATCPAPTQTTCPVCPAQPSCPAAQLSAPAEPIFKSLFTLQFKSWMAGMGRPFDAGPYTTGYGKVENGVQTGTWTARRYDYGNDGWMQIDLHAPSPCQGVGEEGWCSNQVYRPTLLEIQTIPILGYELLTPSAGKQIKMEWELAVDRPITLAAEADQSFNRLHERIMSCPEQTVLPKQTGETEGWRRIGCTLRMPTIYGLPTDPKTGGGGLGINLEIKVPADVIMWVRSLKVWIAD